MLIWSRRPRTSRTPTSADLTSLPSRSAGEGGGGYRQAGSRMLHGPPAPAKGRYQRQIWGRGFVALVAGTWCARPRRPRRSPPAGKSPCDARMSVLRTVRASGSPAHRIPDLVFRRTYSPQATSLAVTLVALIFSSLREAVAFTPVADRPSAAPCTMFEKHGTPLPDVPGVVPC
jgi:hypothetical protein